MSQLYPKSSYSRFPSLLLRQSGANNKETICKADPKINQNETEQIDVQFLGHAFIRITYKGKIYFIDPWVTGNGSNIPNNPQYPYNYIPYCDYVIITHPHYDHFSESTLTFIENQYHPIYISTFEIIVKISELFNITDNDRLVGINKGGYTIIDDSLVINMVSADHTGSCQYCTSTYFYSEPVGYVFEFSNNNVLYITGDTAVNENMKVIQDLYNPNIIIPCIGGFYTMDPYQAFYAIKTYFPNIKTVLPYHYGVKSSDSSPQEDKDKLINYFNKCSRSDPVINWNPGEIYTIN
jgi:L-ascorbate metabolism protein UlaG (beta-lactamase superfamily)